MPYRINYRLADKEQHRLVEMRDAVLDVYDQLKMDGASELSITDVANDRPLFPWQLRAARRLKDLGK